ncbi:DUF1501 domain-containing protein [Novosphingobium aquimarinum]|uniref:DUF1501 domain-containing protein n=1 Tax=Novosphingobium aquimarinum TaxID=2682494 RepID=UPI0012EB635D|nr:DUF1501 domain-containing protein [Novosphingobium aquimarinum]
MVDRRTLIKGGLVAGGIGVIVSTGSLFPISFARANTDKRFVFIILRGAADGLSIVMPSGDPAYMGLRGAVAPEESPEKLDSTFSLHPALTEVGKLYSQRNAIFAQAIASVYRDRSHFDGQNVLESGGAKPFAVKTGWMNRMLSLVSAEDRRAIALASAIPLAMRGQNEVYTYSLGETQSLSDDVAARVAGLYRQDPELGTLWEAAVRTLDLAGDAGKGARRGARLGALAARLLAADDGARIMMIESSGWDTHVRQKVRLDSQLRELDATVGALVGGLGQDWANTMIVVATEFGRTAAINGTGGTDHGTGGMGMVLGGGLGAAKVVADWPGLSPAQLLQNRDLRPTASTEGMIVSAVSRHFAIDPGKVRRALYSELSSIKFPTF